MQKIGFLAVPALLLFAGCDMYAPQDQGTAPPGGIDSKTNEWETLPKGRSFLQTGQDSSGNPVYAPIRLLDTMALIDGDIVLASGSEQMAKLRAALVDPAHPDAGALGKSSGFVRTSTYTGRANAWPGGYIPYLIGGGVNRNTVEQAVYEFNQSGSGIVYVPRKVNDAQGVVFIGSSEQVSSSAVGLTTPGQWQGIYIVDGSSTGVIMHEMGHAAGLYHEHARPDRASYVNITASGTDKLGMWDRGFAIPTDGTMEGSYDLTSIMHYFNGSIVYANPDGTKYTVNLSAKNGQATGNSHFSAGDKVSLWDIPINQNPWLPTGAEGGVGGKVTKPFATFVNGAYKKFLLTYDPVGGISNVTALNEDNSISNSVQNFNVGAGFNIVTPYSSNTGAPCMLFYSTSTGAVKLYNLIPVAGALGSLISWSRWNPGWTAIEFYESGNQRYWFFQNASNQLVNIWGITDDGNLGPQTYTATWPGWNYSKPFYIETSPAVTSTYFLFRNGAGLTRIRAMTSTGVLGSVVADINLPNYPTVGLWQSVSKAYMAIANGKTLYIVDMDNTGFRNTGLAFYRVLSTSLPVDHIESAPCIYNSNAGGAFINNKIYDFKQVTTLKWTGIPGSVFTGLLAPYH